jgi:hypothetical protein
MTKPKATSVADTINVLKKAKCPNSTNTATLEYELGQDKSKGFYFKITENSGGGFWAIEWISWKEIKDALSKVDPITSYPLRDITKRRSVNTSSFLMAVLLAEGLIERLPEKQRYYKLTGKNPSAAKKAAPRKAPAKKAKK